MENLREALGWFKYKKILVIGDILLDKFIWGNIEKVNPEQPVAPLVKVLKENYVLGGAANVANNIASLGARVCLCGIVGNDMESDKIRKRCSEKGILLKEFDNGKPTIVKKRVMAYGQQVTRLDFGEDKIEKINESLQEEILKFLKEEIKNFDFIILSDYDKFFFSENISKKIIELANLNNIKSLVDPKPKNIDFFKGCTVISPNKHEAEEITKLKYSNGKETLSEMGKILSDRIGAEYIIITCGEDGVFSYHNGDSDLVETVAKEVSDVTGAGDTFAATLALGLACNLNIHDAAKLANYAAGVVVEKVGTATATTEEIEKMLENE